MPGRIRDPPSGTEKNLPAHGFDRNLGRKEKHNGKDECKGINAVD